MSDTAERNIRVIGFTGMPGAGKSEAVSVARSMGFEIFSMGDVVRCAASGRRVPLDDPSVGAFATEERRIHGKDVWAKRTAEKIRAEGSRNIVIDGIRSIDEIDFFRREFGRDFVLIAIHTKSEERLDRILKRAREDDVRSMRELENRDTRELGWGIGSAIAKADIMIVNDSTLEEFRERVKETLLSLKADAEDPNREARQRTDSA